MVGLHGLEASLQNLLKLPGLERLLLLEPTLLLGQFPDLAGVNALEPGLEVFDLLPQRDVGVAKLVQLALVGEAALDIEEPGAIALELKGLEFSRRPSFDA